MTTQEDGRALHRAAMDVMDEHDRLLRAGNKAGARVIALDALQLERRALRHADALKGPYRSLIYRSAASIALDAGLPNDALALIGEALTADDVPEALSSQLKEIARTARERIHVPAAEATWHRLRIFGTRSSEVTMSAVSRAMDVWFDYLFAAVEARIRTIEKSMRDPKLEFLPVATAEGSFVAGMDVVAPSEERKYLATILAELRDAVRNQKTPPPIELRAWSEVLDVLGSNSLGLEAILRQPGQPTIAFSIDATSVSNQRSLVEKEVNSKLFSSEVPQANDIERVFHLLELTKSAGGRPDPEEVNLDPRDLAYYRNAAEVLHFLDQARRWRLTDAGKRVVAIDSKQRLAFTAVEFEGTRVGRAWIEWSKARTLFDLDPDTATNFIKATVVDLSDATIRRRAQTLASWVRALKPYHYANKSE